MQRHPSIRGFWLPFMDCLYVWQSVQHDLLPPLLTHFWFMLVTGYLVCLLAVSVMSQQRGQSVWSSSVADLKVGAFPKFGGPSGDGKDPAMNYYPQAGSQAPLHPYPPTTSPAISQGYDANTNGMGAGRQVQSSYPQV